MKTQHTSGPWELDEQPRTVSQYRIYDTETGGNVGWFDPDQEHIESGEANARLIASAPELLRSLKEIKFLLAGYLGESETAMGTDYDALEQAEQAIAKAEGK